MIEQFLQLNAKDTFFLLLPYISTATAVFFIVFIPCKIRLRKNGKAIVDLIKTTKEMAESNKTLLTISKAHESLVGEHVKVKIELNNAKDGFDSQSNRATELQKTISEQDRCLKEFGDKLITSDLKITELTKKIELCSQKKISKKLKLSRKKTRR